MFRFVWVHPQRRSDGAVAGTAPRPRALRRHVPQHAHVPGVREPAGVRRRHGSNLTPSGPRERSLLDGGGLVLVRAGTYSTGAFPLTLKSRVTQRGQAFAAKLAPSGTREIIATRTTRRSKAWCSTPRTSHRKAGAPFNAAVHNNVRIENNSFLPPTVPTGTFCRVGYELGNLNRFRWLHQLNELIARPSSAQGGATLPIERSAI
jgi:hypothetical protein